jgi:hypothetical protein
MLKSRDAPDTGNDFAGYSAYLKAGYRISGEAGYPARFLTEYSRVVDPDSTILWI